MRMTIGKKLLAGFATVALLMACLGAFALYRMSAINANASDLGSNWLEKVKNIGLARVKLNRMRTLEMRMLVEDSDAALEATEKDFNQAKADNDEALKKVEALLVTDEGKRLLAELREIEDKYIDIHKQIVAAQRQKKEAEADALMLGPSKEVFDEYIENVESLTKNFDEGADKAVAESASAYGSARILTIATVIALTALGLGIGLWLSRGISRRVTEVAERVEMLRSVCITGVGEGIKSMARGDLSYSITPKTPDLEVNSRDELGDLAKSVNGIIAQTKETVKIYDETRGMLKTLLVEDAGAALGAAAQRDLTRRVVQKYEGVFDLLKGNVNRVLESLDEALSQVASSAEQVSSASSQISSGAESLAQGTSEQASSIEEVSSSLQEMASMAKQNVGNAKEARSLAEGARGSVERGAANMQNLSEAISKIKASADSTARIVKTIDEIAFQTNLLALNAAVEAARAGDAGKGFAVVAEEVRNLAMRSADAAKSTAVLIEESVKNADNGVALNEGVAATLREINEQVQKVSEMMAEVAAASEQQNQGVDQINSAVEQMNQVTQQAAANAEESASASEELSGQAEELLSMVNSFSLTSSSASSRRPASQAKRPAAKRTAPAPKARPAAQQLAHASNGNGNGYGHAKTLIPFDDEDAGVLGEF